MAIRLYIVDDEEAIRRSLRLMLRLSGYEVRAFESGVALLGEVEGLEPGCILLDVRMAEMDGLEVQQELNRRGVDMPVVVMTGHGDIAVAVAALRAGADDFVEKPFERAKIVEAIDRAWLRVSDPGAYAGVARQAVAALDALSRTERKVLEAFSEGLSNQAAATALGLGVNSVEVARAGFMARLEAASLPDAIRIAYLARRLGAAT